MSFLENHVIPESWFLTGIDSNGFAKVASNHGGRDICRDIHDHPQTATSVSCGVVKL